MGTYVANFINDVFQTNDISSYVLFDLGIRFNMNSLFAYFTVEFFVDELADQLFIGFSPGNIILYSFELPNVGRSALYKDSRVDFSEVKFGQYDLLLPGDVSGTSDSEHEQ